jgi:hypothetical protein
VEVRHPGSQAVRAYGHVAWRGNDALNGIDIIDRPWQVKSGRSKARAALIKSTQMARECATTTRVRRSTRPPVRHAAALGDGAYAEDEPRR